MREGWAEGEERKEGLSLKAGGDEERKFWVGGKWDEWDFFWRKEELQCMRRG